MIILLGKKRQGKWQNNGLQVPKESSFPRTAEKREKSILKHEALRLPIRKPTFISTLVIPNLFGLVLPCFCLFFYYRVLKITQGEKRLGDICTHTLKLMGIEINVVANGPARVLRPHSGRWGGQAWQGETSEITVSQRVLVPKLTHAHGGFRDNLHLKDIEPTLLAE